MHSGQTKENEKSPVLLSSEEESVPVEIELKKAFISMIKRILIVFIFFFCITCFFSNNVIDLFKSILPSGIDLVAFSPADVFMAIIEMAVILSILLSLPFILVEVIRFISPALFGKEKKFLYRFLPISLSLFLMGMIFGVWVMAFLGMNFLAEFSASYGVKNYWSFNGVLESFYLAGVGFGLAFQFPLMMYFLNKFNIVSAEKMGAFRGHVVVLLLFVSALLTPSPDALSQIIMFIPIYALFELTLLYLKISNKNRRNRDDRNN